MSTALTEAKNRTDWPWYKSYPEAVPKTIEDNPPLIPELLRTAAAYEPHNGRGVDFLGVKHTYKEIQDGAVRIARNLLDLGIQKGEPVALLLNNVTPFILASLGIQLAGGAVAPIYATLEGEELAAQIVKSKARIIIALSDTLAGRLIEIRKTVKNHSNLKRLVIADLERWLPQNLNRKYPARKYLFGSDLGVSERPKDYGLEERVVRFHELLKPARTRRPLPKITGDDLAVLFFTSGTTALEAQFKAAKLTHHNLAANVAQFRASSPNLLNYGHEKFNATAPYFHCYGYTVCFIMPMGICADIALFPYFRSDLAINETLRHRKTERPISVAPWVEAMYTAVLDNPKSRDAKFDTVRFPISAAYAIADETVLRWEDEFGHIIRPYYGLTETSPLASGNFAPEPKMGSIGLPAPSTIFLIVDPEDYTRVLATGEVGELAIFGPQVTSGYLDDPEATAAAIKDGWLLTGDLAHMDDDGFFYIDGRKKEMYVVGGEKVWPSIVDRVIEELKAVDKAVTVGLPQTGKSDHEIVAVVVKRPGSWLTSRTILEHCRLKLPKYSVPKKVVFQRLDDLPLTATKKPKRGEIIAQLLGKK